MARGRSLPHGVLWLSLLIGTAALVAELGQAAAAHYAAQAREGLAAGRPAEALAASTAALRLDPYSPEACYFRLVALKGLDQWGTLAGAAARTARWHPDTSSVLRLWGEAAWRLDRPAEAATALWSALWRNPTPKENPAQFWRLAMLAGRDAWGARDPRVTAAAVRMLGLLGEDERLSAHDRQTARREAAALFQAAGAPLSARAALAGD